MKKIFNNYSLIFALLLIIGCTPNSVKSVTSLLQLAKSVVILVDTFAQKSETFTNLVNKVSGLAQSSLKKGESIEKIAKFWEQQWQKIHNKYDELNTDLVKLHNKTFQYFQELESNNSMINDEKLKEEDLRRTLELKQQWEVEYKKALLELKNAEEMLKQGDDFMYILKNELIRSEVNSSIDRLDLISNQAINLSKSIDSFENNTKAIFNL